MYDKAHVAIALRDLDDEIVINLSAMLIFQKRIINALSLYLNLGVFLLIILLTTIKEKAF